MSEDDPSRFSSAQRFVCFLGHPRSGHSVLGAVLNAHRNALVSHNLDALGELRRGVGRDELFLQILARERRMERRGRRTGGYVYVIPGQWQGYCDEIRVIGDKRAGSSSRHLAADPTLLRNLPAKVGLPVSVIHHVRNPWDNIASIWKKKDIRAGRSLAEIADEYFALLDAIHCAVQAAGDAVQMIETVHESLVANPVRVLTAVLERLELPADAGFLEACARFVHSEPRRTRHDVTWPQGLVESIALRATHYPCLSGYALEMPPR